MLMTLICCSALHAQGVGDPAVNKTFLNSWNTPGGQDELFDYQPKHVVLLDWFGVS